MPAGVPIGRQFVVVLHNGLIVIDWGDGTAFDIDSGEFIAFSDRDLSHNVMDDELEMLRHMSRIADYDGRNVYVTSMPDSQHHSHS